MCWWTIRSLVSLHSSVVSWPRSVFSPTLETTSGEIPQWCSRNCRPNSNECSQNRVMIWVVLSVFGRQDNKGQQAGCGLQAVAGPLWVWGQGSMDHKEADEIRLAKARFGHFFLHVYLYETLYLQSGVKDTSGHLGAGVMKETLCSHDSKTRQPVIHERKETIFQTNDAEILNPGCVWKWAWPS